MIDRLIIKNFKSIGEPGVDLELKPLTILVGPNGSGKSSILEALALFTQSLGQDGFNYVGREYYYEGRIYYPQVSFPSGEEIFYARNPDNWITMEFHIELGGEEERRLWKLAEEVNREFKDREFEEIDKVSPLGYRYKVKQGKWGMLAEQSILVNKREIITIGREYYEEGKGIRHVFKNPSFLVEISPLDDPLRILNARSFTCSQSYRLNAFAEKAIHLFSSIFFIEGRSKVFFISALRGRIKPREETKQWGEWVGIQGENLLSVLSQAMKPANHKKKEKIGYWADQFGIKDPWAGLVSPSALSGEYIEPLVKIPLNLALASHGERQVLTVITQLFFSEPGDIIMIEEPEISLHPEGQVKVIELFAEAIKEEKQIIATTHSSFLIRAIGSVVKKGLLKAEDVAVYEVVKEEDKGTIAKRLELDERGYIKGWIPTFVKVEKELLKDWWETLPEE